MKENNITVVGIFVVDISVYVEKLPLTGQTIIGQNYIIGPGGKGSNQSVAIAKAGGNVSLIARIGNDDFGKIGVSLYKKVGVNIDSLIIVNKERTGCATISIDEKGMNTIVVVPSAANGLTPEIINEKKNLIKHSKLLISGFETPKKTTYQALKIGREFKCLNLLNPAPFINIRRDMWSFVDYATPNEHEASEITGIKVKDINSAFEAGVRICEMGAKNTIITMGELGAVTIIDGKKGSHHYPPKLKEKVIDTVGAGDVFNGAFSLAVSEDIDIDKAVKYANSAASISVRKKGAATSAPSEDEIMRVFNKYVK